MFDLSALFKRAGKVAAENSPAILTAIGVTGTLTSVYLAAKGAFQASEILREAEDHRNESNAVDGTEIPEIDLQQKAELTWQCYVPAATCAALAVTAVICSNRISDRRTAALASAYTIVKDGFAEYRAKNVEKLGAKKEQELRDEIVAERLNRRPYEQTQIVLTGRGSTLCYDMWNDRYFESDMETIRKAVNDFNQQVINETYGSMTDFYHLIGLDSTGHSDDFGWDTDKLLELDFSAHLHADGTPSLAIDFKTKPNSRFASFDR